MSMQGHMQREKKACRLAAPFYLTEMEIMYEITKVTLLQQCIQDYKSYAFPLIFMVPLGQ
jgi:hypothetical protein